VQADAGFEARILRRLHQAEAEHAVKILLAVESGSRAWGFASPDSDFDVRFIYVRPESHYLTLNVENQRDVIEYPITDEIDINGWDLRKALRLLGATNPAIVEWLQSPITYRDHCGFRAEARALLPTVFSQQRSLHHYRHMAAGNYRSYLQGDSVLLKKYFYVLRPLLAVRWVELFSSPPPMEFARLMTMLAPDAPVAAAVQALLERKSVTSELGRGERVPVLNAFIESELTRPLCAPREPAAPEGEPWAALNALFVRVLRQA
jgi:predicted nucleotidyltransferase